jgi:hypothetical protein
MQGEAANFQQFHELKRRNVLRAAVLQAGAVWALSQGFAQLAPIVGAPEWAVRWFLLAAIIGFPFWIAFTWFHEFTPDGIKRDSAIGPAFPNVDVYPLMTHLLGLPAAANDGNYDAVKGMLKPSAR